MNTPRHIISNRAWEIFPDFAPKKRSGSGLVWMIFNDSHWDLDWSNSDVLIESVDLLCWLTNEEVEVLRLG
ncbi:hypothetical protein [Propionibacterium sp. oral taxon 192]|uniref:hypothetical protein n=1 Tax=Propionibacterium sp. oral taxon 192 TaxID=671222 RepID=UPI0012EC354F|nr:hypothetical protein [Propionibacterium sp. oral taxon 192]